MRRIIMTCLAVAALLMSGCRDKTVHHVLFGGQDIALWESTGDVKVQEGVLTLSGEEASVVLKEGNYRNFIFNAEVMTDEGRGEIYFHTDPSLSKGYAVAVNNDTEHPVWWKMTGSLVSVRNLTKSFVAEREWFPLNIIVNGSYIRVEIDGEPVVEYIEPAEPYRLAEHAGKRLSSGTFAIVNNSGGDLKFRNISLIIPDHDEKIYSNRESFSTPMDEQTDRIIRLHQEDFPVLDYHVHLKGGLTKEQAAVQSRRTGINYAIAPNCGVGFPITNDQEVITFLDTMRIQPFILAMQAEGREWIETFSPEVRGEFDYVFTDALTFTDHKGRRTRLWIPEETWIEDEQQYMDLIVDKIVAVLDEPVDIYVNPCFLPSPLDEKYDLMWTEARMNRFVSALARSGKALEINELYNIPNKAIIMKAKEAGVKFTFGSNNVEPAVSMLEYGTRMKEECGITAEDMYKPDIKIRPASVR